MASTEDRIILNPQPEVGRSWRGRLGAVGWCAEVLCSCPVAQEGDTDHIDHIGNESFVTCHIASRSERYMEMKNSDTSIRYVQEAGLCETGLHVYATCVRDRAGRKRRDLSFAISSSCNRVAQFVALS
jgi:hypothetical protein